MPKVAIAQRRRTWSKVAIGIFFLIAAEQRATTGGHVLPGPGPTFLFLLVGAWWLFDGLRPRARG